MLAEHKKSVEIIIEQEGNCTYPKIVSCKGCPIRGHDCGTDEINLIKAKEFLAMDSNITDEIIVKEVDDNKFIAISFPDIQEYQDLDGFDENSTLINDGPLMEEYGLSAYMVRLGWFYRQSGTIGEI